MLFNDIPTFDVAIKALWLNFDAQTDFIAENAWSKFFTPKFIIFSFNFNVSEFSINFICFVKSLQFSNNLIIIDFFFEFFIFSIFFDIFSLISEFSSKFKKYSFTLKGIEKLSGYLIHD